MSNPGDVAKALRDALPSLDQKKLLEQARKSMGVVVVGEEAPAAELIRLLRLGGEIPADSKLALWWFVAGGKPPLGMGKNELVLVIPATEEYLKQAHEHFANIPILPIVLGDATPLAPQSKPVRIGSIDADEVRKHLVPELVERTWEWRLAVGRALPAVRDHLSWVLAERATRNWGLLLGSVAGAGTGRNGAPTPATVQLLAHQAALIVSIAAIYGQDLEDRRALISRVVPHITPTLMLDLAEAGISSLAKGAAEGKRGDLYAMAAVAVARPALTASSTLLVGLAARRVFRPADPARARPEGASDQGASIVGRAARRSRDLGRRAAGGAGQGAAALGDAIARRLRRRAEDGSSAQNAAERSEGGATDPAPPAPVTPPVPPTEGDAAAPAVEAASADPGQPPAGRAG